MAESYKLLYEQTKKMLAMYRDEIVPGLRDQLAQKWIPVTERLPEELKEVLTYSDFYGTNGFEECEYQISFLYDGKFQMLNHPECVTHWMPLPEPPKEGE